MTGRLHKALPWLAVALLAAAVVAAGLAGSGRRDGPPLDPRSTAPDGTKGLVELLRALGAEVEVGSGPPTAATDTVLLLEDTLDEPAGDELLAWVRQGGVLVVADPSSTLTDLRPGAYVSSFGIVPVRPGCDYPLAAGVRQVRLSGDQLFEVPPGAVGCFRQDGAAWLVAQDLEQGHLVRVGGPGFLVNSRLGEADNAVLAANLLAPRRGSRVLVLLPPPPGGGDRSLFSLIAPQVWLALLQLALAFLALALWRGRRLGQPVLEPQPVQIPGSEIVLAVGNLLHRARSPGQAGTVLAEDLRRTLAERLGLPASVPVERLADAAAERTGVPRERLLSVLGGTPRSEAELATYAQTIESIRREVVSVR